MDLQMGQMSRRVYCKACKMTRLVIKQVEAVAEKQGYKSVKFLNRKKEALILEPIDTLNGVMGRTSEVEGIIENADGDYLPEEPGEGSDGEDEPLIVDLGVDSKELADLLDEGGNPSDTQHDNPSQNIKEGNNDDRSEGSRSDEDDLGN